MTAENPVSVRQEGDIAWVTIDSPPVNATSTPVRAGLARAIDQAQRARYAVLQCAGKTFVAGGDMTEFDRPAEQPLLPDVVQAIEDSKTPFLALMHGTVLGGGFEIAMACAWRIATPDARFGLPEVNVGLVPGAGGSQRLPRLIGMAAAIDLACSGKMLGAAELLALGGLDEVAKGDLQSAARAFLAAQPERPMAVSQRKTPVSDPDFWENAASRLAARAKGQKAPLHNLEALKWAQLPFREGQPKERELHLALRQSSESRALRHVFFAERAVARPAAIGNTTARDISHVAIVGGGLMGAGIAGACLAAGLRVTVLETSEEAAQAGRERVVNIIDGALSRGKIDEAGHGAQLAQLNVTTDYDAAAGADLAVEAVFEDLGVKREVFAKLAAVLGKDAILATNTSYLDPEKIFEGVENPDRCLGLHFFSPAHVMRLLEIVRTPATSPQTLATGFALARKLRKIGVLAGICDGFIGNRMLSAYRRQADYLLADGALPHEVDAAMRAFGMPMGPYELQDLTGLQIAWANRKRQAGTRPGSERYVTIADQLCEMGRLGQRAGRGWYRYEKANRKPVRDPEIEALVKGYSAEQGIERRAFSDDEIQARLVAVLVNEGARIVEEGIAAGPDDVDIVQVHGYGFPRWRGGPMHYGESVGLAEIARSMRQVADQSPGSWQISRLLDRQD